MFTDFPTSAMDPKIRAPFADLKIDSHEKLHEAKKRVECHKCGSSRMYFCYSCYELMPAIVGGVPTVKLPLQVDIIKHRLELDGKSTAVHARLLAPDHVTIYTYPDVPQYEHTEKILLVFPFKDAVSLEDIAKEISASKCRGKCTPAVDLESAKESINSNPKCELHHQHHLDNQRSFKEDANGSETPADLDWSSQETLDLSSALRHRPSFDKPPEPETCEDFKSDSMMDSVERLQHRTSQCNLAADTHDFSHLPPKHLSTPKAPVVEDSNGGSQETRTKKAECADNDNPFERVIFIDCTWNQCNVIKSDERFSGMRRVIIKDRETTFWRTQKGKPQTYLATIEAIYYFLKDFHQIILGKEYDSQFDNLLFFYSFMHGLVQKTAEERQRIATEKSTRNSGQQDHLA